ncbi:DUF4129 domain-containing protein [Subtercola vilae]|uniref:DUF4129 domain-containing protein n=1 Tax=Subtercola vilae TaxID=2056433 RepID=A0A4T2C2J0_9MICO|nr:DUF4129 domain-containing protein [Subtercola vilae]
MATGLGVLTDIPLDPSAPDARQWLIDELAKPEYQAAKPTWLDQAASAVRDWLGSLFVPSSGNLGGLLPVVIVTIAVGLVVAAFIVFGRPRRNRSAAEPLEALFGVDDRRSSSQLRASAAAAAASGDYRTAVEELYRSIARRQSERTVVRVSPGTTAQEFAARAALSYPAEAGALVAAARVFDEVRYLGATATKAAYEQLAALERQLRDLAPVSREPVGVGTPGGPGAGLRA